MSGTSISSLPTLKPDSGVRITSSIIHGLRYRTGSKLVRVERRDGSWVYVAQSGGPIQYGEKFLTFTDHNNAFMNSMNLELKGGRSYPVVTAVLGAAVGLVPVVGVGAALMFTATTTAIDLSRRDTNVLARRGDEVWAFEAIGKTYERNYITSNRWVAEHIISYVLYDPFRRGTPQTGWLIHETRNRAIIE